MKLAAFVGLLALVAVLAVVGIQSSQTVVWDGDYPQEEFHFVLRDRQGQPVTGVELRVENTAGQTFYFFPVADYLPDHIPTSDADGSLTFHHAPRSPVSGQARIILGHWVDSGIGPNYVCRFVRNGRELYRVAYNDLAGKGQQTVKRPWKWPTAEELEDQVYRGESEKWKGSREHMSRDERWFAAAVAKADEKATEIKYFGRPAEEELEFHVVERTVTVDP